MAHTYDLTTNIGEVRLLIGDTDITPITDAQFSDEEIQVFLTMASSVILIAAAYALESWAATESAALDSEKVGDYAYTRGAVNKKLTLAKEYKREAQLAIDAEASAPYFTWAEMDLSGVENTDEDVE